MRFGNGVPPQWAQPPWQQPQQEPYQISGMPAPMGGQYGGGMPGAQQPFNPPSSAVMNPHMQSQMQFL
jgi:hypothetical protein